MSSTRNFSAVARGGIFPPGAPLRWSADNLRVTFAIGADGVTEDVTVPDPNEPAGSFILTWKVTRTDGQEITSDPLVVAIVAPGPPPTQELTGGTTIQNS